MRATSLAPALTIALALVLTIRPGLAQTPTAQTPSASIAGVVYSTDPTPVPVRDARVMLNSAALTAGRLATTDAAGRFVFRALPTGEYRLDGQARLARTCLRRLEARPSGRDPHDRRRAVGG